GWMVFCSLLFRILSRTRVIKNDGRDWRHFEMPNWHFILVKWVCIIQSIQKSSDPFQYLQYWKEFDTMIAHKIYH
ncbi:hypothetical protein, partial [Prevotellamassilia timonensis]|uniref:hypothetical protein n=1 Tax=Prevotellamassilia timonensis TaxID=1852370 RepID=UPI004027AF3E